MLFERLFIICTHRLKGLYHDHFLNDEVTISKLIKELRNTVIELMLLKKADIIKEVD